MLSETVRVSDFSMITKCYTKSQLAVDANRCILPAVRLQMEGKMPTVHMSPRRETFGTVLRKNAFFIVLLSGLLIALIIFSVVIQLVNANRETIRTTLPPSEFSLKPIKTEVTQERSVTLTETTPVEQSYFDDALFCGDSISDGIRIYDLFKGYDTCTKIGISPTTVMEDAFFKTEDGQKLTMTDTIVFKQPKKVYIMLGTNGLEWSSIDSLVEGYGKFLDDLKSKMPALDIILESIPPTTKELAAKRTAFSSDNINAYNAAVLTLAKAKGCYFLDVHSVVVGEDGYLIEEIAAPDGIHFQVSGYQLWKDYLFTHTVQGSAAYSIGPDGSMMFTSA